VSWPSLRRGIPHSSDVVGGRGPTASVGLSPSRFPRLDGRRFPPASAMLNWRGGPEAATAPSGELTTRPARCRREDARRSDEYPPNFQSRGGLWR
jgi:hypothetical protein